ncbi:MAG TPA: hypothetical protein VNZ22_03585 [Bacillota bacterium]|nr:hypothetical protein [Bacillota bacterium]
MCQHCTEWSGLGVIDVLAGTLDLPEADRGTVRSWYERHWSFFRVLRWHEERGEVKCITVRNLVTGQPYVIRMNMTQCPFIPGMVVYGALTFWPVNPFRKRRSNSSLRRTYPTARSGWVRMSCWQHCSPSASRPTAK